MKSILFTLVTFLFLFSACSTTRYGHLTMRSNSDYSKSERQVKVKKKVQEQIENGDLLEDSEEIFQETLPQLEEIKAEIKTMKPKPTKAELKQAAALAVELVKDMPTSEEAVKTKIQEFTKTQPAATNAEGGLIRLILIVLLILLVVQLIAQLLPAIAWILHVVTLIILIWFILKLLGYL